MWKRYIFLFPSPSLFALTILGVSLDSDNNPGGIGESGDLRYALNVMNQNLNGSIDDYAIVFDHPMTIQLQGILPLINNSFNSVNITIGNDETSSFPVTIDGDNLYNGFFIPMGNVTIQNITFQNMIAKGGDGGDGISGGGGGMGAGGAIYAPQAFLNGIYPSITLRNVSINNCSAVGGNGGSYFSISSPTGNEGGGGGGGLSGNGGSITTTGSTGGGGGGGFGGNGGDVTLSAEEPSGGGGGGGGGIGSRTTVGSATNLGNGGSDQDVGSDGNGYGLTILAGSGASGSIGGSLAGGGGGGGDGGGGGGSAGSNGTHPLGSIPPGGGLSPSGGNGGDGGGGGGGGVVTTYVTNGVDGEAGRGQYGGGGGGGAGTGSYSDSYTVKGGDGGIGGGGGGGGVNQSGETSSDGGNSSGGGGGGGGGPSDGPQSVGGSDTGYLQGGSGGSGATSYGSSSGGGGGGGGSGLGGAIFVDTGLNLTLQAFSGIPTFFNTSNNTTQKGVGGSGGPGAENGSDGWEYGNDIFLRQGASLTLRAQESSDLLTLGSSVSFTDDTSAGGGGTSVFVTGEGTIIYNGSTEYAGTITINNANFKVNGRIEEASIFVCRNISISSQRGTLSGKGVLTGDVYVNSGRIFPDRGEVLALGNLVLNSANPETNTLGSLVHIEMDSSGTSSVSVSGSAFLAGRLEIDLDPNTLPGTYTLLTSSDLTGTFDSIAFTRTTPNYSLSYLPLVNPTFVQFDLFSPSPSLPLLPTQGLRGNSLRVATYLNRLAPEANSLGLTEQFELLNTLSSSEYQKALRAISPSRNSIPTFAAQNVMFMFSDSLASHFTQRRLARHYKKERYGKETAFLADNAFLAVNHASSKMLYTPPKNTHSQLWAMGFGQFSSQESQDQTPGFDFNSGGFFTAYDYGNTDQGCMGALLGYAHSSIQEDQSMGDSHLNAGYLSLYGMRYFSDFFLDVSLWGNYMAIDQKRLISFPGFKETATSSYQAEQLDLHFGTGYDFTFQAVTLEPFSLLDWVYEWDPRYVEKGAFPYNMEIPSRTSWMLRLETGLKGYHTTTYSWGTFIAQGKLSYVYKKPDEVGHLTPALVNAPLSFSVEAFTREQSLISPAIELFWQTEWNGYGSISYDGEFGSGYASNQFYGKIGYSF